jgi:hypothetical protein
MHLVLFGVLKIEKNPDHDVIRIFLPSLEPVFIYLWRVEGCGAPRGAPRRVLIVNR